LHNPAQAALQTKMVLATGWRTNQSLIFFEEFMQKPPKPVLHAGIGMKDKTPGDDSPGVC
jgi:hypothetical protein